MPFAEWIESQAAYFRSLGNSGADWLAAEIDELASLARFFRADTPDQLCGRRREAESDLIREAWDNGYRSGVALGRVGLAGRGPGHDG